VKLPGVWKTPGSGYEAGVRKAISKKQACQGSLARGFGMVWKLFPSSFKSTMK
jgi:hypothetical protein